MQTCTNCYLERTFLKLQSRIFLDESFLFSLRVLIEKQNQGKQVEKKGGVLPSSLSCRHLSAESRSEPCDNVGVCVGGNPLGECSQLQ